MDLLRNTLQRWSAIMNLLDVLDPLKLIYLMNQDLM